MVGPSKQASKHTHAECNEITLVWGSLRLAPIKGSVSLKNGGCSPLKVQQRPSCGSIIHVQQCSIQSDCSLYEFSQVTVFHTLFGTQPVYSGRMQSMVWQGAAGKLLCHHLMKPCELRCSHRKTQTTHLFILYENWNVESYYMAFAVLH